MDTQTRLLLSSAVRFLLIPHVHWNRKPLNGRMREERMQMISQCCSLRFRRDGVSRPKILQAFEASGVLFLQCGGMLQSAVFEMKAWALSCLHLVDEVVHLDLNANNIF